MDKRSVSSLVGAIGLLFSALAGCSGGEPKDRTPAEDGLAAVKLGISPYPDTGLPVLTDKQGLFKQEGLSVELKILQWGEVMPALASGSLDVVIQNMNSFQEVYGNLKAKGKELVFYRPLFVFRGGGLMVRGNSGMVPLSEMLKRNPNRAQALRQTILQLKGKAVITPHGTDHEQMVLAALKLAGLEPKKDVRLRYAEGDDGVAAFVGGEADACTGGLVQRLAVEQRGGYVLFEMDDVTPPVINGLITTRDFAERNPKTLDKLAASWFATIRYMDADPKGRSKPFLDFLASQGSARFTPEQYVSVWQKGDVFPRSEEEAAKLFDDPSSKYYWKNSWSAIARFLLESKKIATPAPESAYWHGK
jgi:NitT/TauT family transport system substrate-binding protein